MKLLRKIFVVVLVTLLLVSCSDKSKDKANKESNPKYFSKVEQESKFSKDPEVPENIIEITNTAVKVKVIEKDICDYYFKDLPFPQTKYKVELKDVIMGDIKNLTEVYDSGGDIRLDRLIKHFEEVEPSDIKKMGLDKITEEQSREEYVKYTFSYNYDLLEGEEYILVIGPEGRIVDNGYGIFIADKQEQKQTSTNSLEKKSYKNVISKNEFPEDTLSK